MFSVFLLNCKSRDASTTWQELIRKPLFAHFLLFAHFQEYHRNHEEKLRVYLGDAVTKLQTFVWIFNDVSRVTT